MSSYGTYRITEKKCAVCSYWNGSRTIDFRANKPYIVKAQTGLYECIAQGGKKVAAADRCLKFQIWEKL